MSDTRYSKIIETLERIFDFLERHEKPDWASLVHESLCELKASDTHGRERLYRYMRGAFLGTMGSLNDVILFKSPDGELVEDPPTFRQLQHLLHELHEALTPDF